MPNHYKHTGQEWIPELGMDLYDHHARQYDPWVGRWWAVDPLAEDYVGWSEYHYVAGNPVLLTDPTGLGYSTGDNGIIYYRKDVKSQEQFDALKDKLPGEVYVGNDIEYTSAESGHEGENMYGDENGRSTRCGGTTVVTDFAKPHTVGIGMSGAAFMGIGFEVGMVYDGRGNSSPYFTLSAVAGLGGSVGISENEIIRNDNSIPFTTSNFAGNGVDYGAGIGPLSYHRGANKSNEKGLSLLDPIHGSDYTTKGFSLSRNIQSSFFKKIGNNRIGATASYSKTWVW